MDILAVLFRWIHIGAAAYWLAAGFYQWQVMRAEASMEAATWISYNRKLYAASKLAIGMPISVLLTTVAGVVLYGLAQYWNRGFGSFGSILFHVGVLAGLAAFGHGIAVLSKSSKAIGQALRSAGDNPSKEQIATVQAAVDNHLKLQPLHYALVAAAFLLMIAGASIP
ncbi:MAG: hypothetical protein BroJett007_19300 [Chloroflexota bacterium]|nr:MAG: hypothetical protein B6D42_06055 [Anaerolineae bacterium UTCFX5]GIK28792.1 MAG: hypothetical protein BroJett007_19300 [Chloroflexota bacterium]